MKIRYPVIGIILILIIVTAFDTILPYEIRSVLGLLSLICLGLIIYLIVRNISRAIVGAKEKPKEP